MNIWGWIFNRERTVEKILIVIILIGMVMLFKNSITNLLVEELMNCDSLVNQLLTP